MKQKESPSGIAHNALAAGTLIKGSIYAEEDMRIDGKVEGLIESAGRIVIGPQADIQGDIRCSNLDITGNVSGNLDIREALSIHASGNFTGDMTAGSLEIAPGARFNGTCRMQ
jgi:cytoskeletal protein CcmA (bactofilin family)